MIGVEDVPVAKQQNPDECQREQPAQRLIQLLESLRSKQAADVGSCGLLHPLGNDKRQHEKVPGDVGYLQFEASDFFDKEEKCRPRGDGGKELPNQRIRQLPPRAQVFPRKHAPGTQCFGHHPQRQCQGNQEPC